MPDSHQYPIEQWVRILDLVHVRLKPDGDRARYIEDGLWLVWPYLRSFERHAVTHRASHVMQLIMRSTDLPDCSPPKIAANAEIMCAFDEMRKFIRKYLTDNKFDIDGYLEQLNSDVSDSFPAHRSDLWIYHYYS